MNGSTVQGLLYLLRRTTGRILTLRGNRSRESLARSFRSREKTDTDLTGTREGTVFRPPTSPRRLYQCKSGYRARDSGF